MIEPAQVGCVIPYAGAVDYILEAVNSALAQGFGEVIIVNDGADPQPLAILSPERRVKIIHLQQSAGCPRARNTGIEACTRPYVVLLDHDDVLCPGYLPAMIEWVEKNRLRCGAATLYYIGENSQRVGSIVSRHPDFFLPSGFFSEVALIREAGFFPDSLSDDLLFFRAIRRLAKLPTCPAARVLYRIHPKAESSRNTTAWWVFNQLLPWYDEGTHSLADVNRMAREYAGQGRIPAVLKGRVLSNSQPLVRLIGRNAYACWLNRDVKGVLKNAGKLLFHLPEMIRLARYKWSGKKANKAN